MKALRSRVAAELVAGSGGLLVSRSADYLVPKALKAADQIIDLCGEDRAEIVARTVSVNSAGILASGFPIVMARWVKGPMELIDLLEEVEAEAESDPEDLDELDEDDSEEDLDADAGAEDGPTAESDPDVALQVGPVDGAPEATTVPPRKPRHRKSKAKAKAAAAASVEPVAPEIPKPPEVSVSSLGLSEDVADLLYEAEIGTSVQALEFDVEKGLEAIVGKDARLVILRSIADKTGADVMV